MGRFKKPPFDIEIRFRADAAAVNKIGRLVDEHMGWSGRGQCSPASHEIVELIFGIFEAKQAGEARKAQREKK